MNKGNNIKLKKITNSDLRFLYQLLAQRDPIANISHRKMPTYDEHIRFVQSKPYSRWYVIYQKNEKVGSIYLSKQDEIGIFLKKEARGFGVGTIAMRLLMKENPRSRFLANISPKNRESAKFFRKNGFTLIQHTYELAGEVE